MIDKNTLIACKRTAQALSSEFLRSRARYCTCRNLSRGDAIVLHTGRKVAASRERVYNETVSYFPCLPTSPGADCYSPRVCENTFPVPRAQYHRMQPGKEDGLPAYVRAPSAVFVMRVYAPHPRDAHEQRRTSSRIQVREGFIV